MTKASILAATVCIWTSAFAATGALAIAVRAPRESRPVASAPAAMAKPPPAPVMEVAEAPPPKKSDRLIVLPTIEIVGSVAHAATPKPKAAPRVAAPVHCSAWRELDQGSSSVQICD